MATPSGVWDTPSGFPIEACQNGIHFVSLLFPRKTMKSLSAFGDYAGLAELFFDLVG